MERRPGTRYRGRRKSGTHVRSYISHERSLIVIDSHTAIYAQGVGLGASKGKEIGKYAEGYSGYVHMAQDAVSDRLHRGRGSTTWLQNGTERIIRRRVNDMEARIVPSRLRPVIPSLHLMSLPRLITHQDSMYSYKLHYNIKYTCFMLLSPSFTRLVLCNLGDGKSHSMNIPRQPPWLPGTKIVASRSCDHPARCMYDDDD